MSKEHKVESDRRDGLERKPNVSMILAEQVLELFEESGTTPREQDTALDIVRTIVLDRVYKRTRDYEPA
jgi:hypothetical protein